MLVRINFYCPQISNKVPNINNVFLSTYRKLLSYEKYKSGPLECSINSLLSSRGKNQGKQITLLVESIAKSDIDLIFIGLTDGWSRVFAVINSDSEMQKFIGNKIIVGVKI